MVITPTWDSPVFLSGGFSAPVAGFYEFTVQLNVDFEDAATFFITVNDVITTGRSTASNLCSFTSNSESSFSLHCGRDSPESNGPKTRTMSSVYDARTKTSQGGLTSMILTDKFVAQHNLTRCVVSSTGTTEFDPDGLYFSTATSSVMLELQAGDVVQVRTRTHSQKLTHERTSTCLIVRLSVCLSLSLSLSVSLSLSLSLARLNSSKLPHGSHLANNPTLVPHFKSLLLVIALFLRCCRCCWATRRWCGVCRRQRVSSPGSPASSSSNPPPRNSLST